MKTSANHASSAPAQNSELERAMSFIRGENERYVLYHDHKESMAFTGLTLFTGAAGAALVSSAWPPSWGANSKLFAFAAITALWLGVLAYLRFQLRRRRWATLRRAGCERVLAKWITSPPCDTQLKPEGRDIIGVSWYIKCADFFWPLKCAVLVMVPTKEDEAIYPAALVEEWLAQEKRPTAALTHERLITFAGWVMYVLVVVRTLMSNVTNVAV